jgi:hypothetical protein
VDYHFICEKILHKYLIASYIFIDHQYADIFTKGLTSSHFLFLRDKLMATLPPMNLRGAITEDTCTSTLANLPNSTCSSSLSAEQATSSSAKQSL